MNQGVAAVGATACSIALLLDERTLQVIDAGGYAPDALLPWRKLSLDTPVAITESARTGVPIWIESREAWAERYPARSPDNPAHHAWATSPLSVKGRVLGAIGFNFSQARSFSQEEQSLILAMAEQCAQALDRAQLYESEQRARMEAERAKQRLAFLAETSVLLTSSLDYETTAKSLANLIIPAFADNYVVTIIDENNALQPVAFAAAEPDADLALREIVARYPLDPKGQGIGLAAQVGQSNYIFDLPLDALVSHGQDSEHATLMQRVGTRSFVNLPLVSREQVIGVMTIGMAQSGRRYTLEDVAIGEELARRVAQAVDNARLYAQAKQAIQVRDEFLSIAAHELKTPVTSLQGSAQLLLKQLDKRGTLDPVQAGRVLRIVEQQSAKLALLLSQLLDVSRMEAGRLTLERSMTDLTVLLTGVIDALQRTHPHPITLNAPETLPAWIDSLRLEQVLVNLLDNAIKFSPEGTPIELQLSVPNRQHICIVVLDHGVGIPVERRGQIFDRFYQAHGEGYKGGMGLGLFVSRQIIELHGGQIQPEFPAEGGTRFVITLPYIVPQSVANGDSL